MTVEEAKKYIKYCMCDGRLVGNTKPIIDEKWQAGLMAIASLDAWEKAKAEIDEFTDIFKDGEFYIKNIDVKRIIDKHLQEVTG